MNRKFKYKLKRSMSFFIVGLIWLIAELCLYSLLLEQGYSVFTAGLTVGIIFLSFIVICYLFFPKVKKRSEL